MTLFLEDFVDTINGVQDWMYCKQVQQDAIVEQLRSRYPLMHDGLRAMSHVADDQTLWDILFAFMVDIGIDRVDMLRSLEYDNTESLELSQVQDISVECAWTYVANKDLEVFFVTQIVRGDQWFCMVWHPDAILAETIRFSVYGDAEDPEHLAAIAKLSI